MPQTESKHFPSFAARATAQKKAKAELERLREIETCARLIHDDIAIYGEPGLKNLNKLGNLLNPPIDPDQLAILID